MDNQSVMFCLLSACIVRTKSPLRTSELHVLTKLVTVWLVIQVGVDLFVTGQFLTTSIPVATSRLTPVSVGVLGTVLWRSKTGFRKTDHVIHRLMRGSIQTGLFAGIFSMGDLITFTRWPDTNMYGMFAIPIGRIYTNVSYVRPCRHSDDADAFVDSTRHPSHEVGTPTTTTWRHRRRLYGE